MSDDESSVGGGGELVKLLPSFQRALRSRNRSPRTIKTYCEAVKLLDEYLGDMRLEDIRRRHIEDFQSHLHEIGNAASTVANRHRSLKQFFGWVEREEEVEKSPMSGMPIPDIPDQPVPVFTEDDLRKIITVCERDKSFEGRRDTAIVRILIDTGCRKGELAGLKYHEEDEEASDVSVEHGALLVTGNGGHLRGVPLGDKAMIALERYLRMRARHRYAKLAWLWLSRRGRLTDQGIDLAIRRRGKEAGIDGVHLHRFRHTFAHRWLSSGGGEGDLMRLVGWKSREMLQVYASSAADERTREAHRRLSLGDVL